MTNRQNNLKKYPYQDLGNELKELRGFNEKEDFAGKLGISLRTYYRYEKGERKVPNGLMKLARILSKSAVVNFKEAQSKEWYSKEDMAAPYHINQLMDDARKILTSGNQAAIDALEHSIHEINDRIATKSRLDFLEKMVEKKET